MLAVKPYMDAVTEPAAGKVAVFGAPFDATTSFRPGARFGPQALRMASEVLESYDPELDRELPETGFCDLGDLDLPPGSSELSVALVREKAAELLKIGAIPLLLGGEHLVSLGAIEAAVESHPDLCVVHLDAHADLRPQYLGVRLSHASVMRLALESLKPESLFQFGIRSGTREEWAFMRGQKTLFPANPEGAKEVLRRLNGRPVYLSLDLDILDPSAFPGTGTTEPGGLSYAQLLALVNALLSARVVAADVVELAPNLDPSGMSAVVAAKIVRTLVLRLTR